MKWVTRKQIHVNRTATAWLIRRFLDPSAEIAFVEANEVAAVQERENAIGFDAPGARYPHQDEQGRCSPTLSMNVPLVDSVSDAYTRSLRDTMRTWRFEIRVSSMTI